MTTNKTVNETIPSGYSKLLVVKDCHEDADSSRYVKFFWKRNRARDNNEDDMRRDKKCRGRDEAV